MSERLLVCVGPSPGSERLVRSAAALAGSLGCPWYAASVTLPRPLPAEEQGRVAAHLRLAEALGGEVALLAGRRTAEALITFAREKGVTRVLVGKPGTPRWRDLLAGSLVDELVRAGLLVEVHGTTGPARLGPTRVGDEGDRGVAGDAAAAVLLVGAATGVGKAASPVLSDADVVMVFLLAVLLAAFLRGRRAAVGASALSVAAFNFFFVPPFHTFAVADTRNLLTFAVLFGVGLLASTLADRLRRQESEAVEREQRTAALLSLTRALSTAADEAAVARAVVEEAAGRIAGGAALYAAGARLAEAGTQVPAGRGEAALVERVTVTRVPERREQPGGGDELLATPLLAEDELLGVLVLRDPSAGASDLADAFARQSALALARVRHAEAAEAASLRARTEELRAALLSTVSHDLRTPLAAVTGAATALLDGEARLSPVARRELLTSVRDEAARLERLVANLLEMTRLASGPVPPRREWVPLDEVVGAAFARVEGVLGSHPTSIDLDPALPLVELDPVLFERVLVNLLENAARHTPPATPIRLAARPTPDGITLVVEDAGPGFPPGDPARLFEPFVRGAAPGTPGSGLGLAICRGIVRAHGGTIRAERSAAGGAAVVILLPSQGEPPPVPAEPEESP